MIGYADIEFASLSDVGVRRSHNQDALATLPASDLEQYQQRGHVFVVADGMGAHAVGELASKIAADCIPHIYSKHAQEGPIAALRTAFAEANVTIHQRGQQNREFQGMGTTATALCVRPEGAWIGHVGDSRAYRVRGDKIQQLTFDHSLLWEMARRQKKDPDQVEGVRSNVIIRSLGPAAIVEPDVEGPHRLRPGDVFLLCSDGLSGLVADREIGAVLSTLPPAEACRFLIHLANLQGGPDNITAVIVRIKGQAGTKDAEEEIPPVPTGPPPPAGQRLKQWFRTAPWPLGLLVGGMGLAGLAIVMASQGWSGQFSVFLVAILVLMAGVVGLMVQNFFDSRWPIVEPPAPRRPRVHRSTDCEINLGTVERLGKASAVLAERIKEKSWEADWDGCHKHLLQAENRQQKGDMEAAFAEHCRALLCLMDAIGRQRHKEEAFKPLWDKAPVS